MAVLAAAEGPILRAILDATYDIWHEGLTPAAYERYFRAQRATTWGAQHLDRVALVDGEEVLASAKQYSFDAVLDGGPIRVVGVGAVFTQPAHRRRGAARELLTRMLERASVQGADLALLFSEIGPDYYARLGFETIPTTLQTLGVRSPRRPGAPAMLARAGEERDLPALVALGSTRAEPFRFHLARDRDLMQYAIAKKRLLAGLGRSGAREVLFFAAEEGASAVAYIVVSVDRLRGVWVVEECGDRDPSGARVGALLQALIARDPLDAPSAITAHLPRGFLPPQVTIDGERPSPNVMMVRALSEKARRALPLRSDDVLYWHSDLF
jgi:GNAT superfamily N-acetyltransferase